MRIVVWGINYLPEVTGIAPFNGALCEFLVAQGHDVTMLTAFPYYPAWRKRARDAGKWFESETSNGVRILRCWHYVPAITSTPRRMLPTADMPCGVQAAMFGSSMCRRFASSSFQAL